jgi:hypothetical protein
VAVLAAIRRSRFFPSSLFSRLPAGQCLIAVDISNVVKWTADIAIWTFKKTLF